VNAEPWFELLTMKHLQWSHPGFAEAAYIQFSEENEQHVIVCLVLVHGH
jgi:acyl-coenzyme A synthetase/AMP-(fatty) acid ligase